MKYTDSKNNIQFNKVQQPGVYHASGPIGLNGRYSTNGDTITGISSEMNLINAIDINWNGAKVESDLEINTTGDLLRWIKSRSSSGGAVDISINDAGYWCINGVSLGVKARGENGLTPYIGPNGNWWIGTTDLGVAASSSSVLENNVTYTSNYISSSTTYQLGILRVGNREYPIIGKNTGSGGGDSSSTTNIIQVLSDNIRYVPTVTSITPGSYEIGRLYIGNNSPVTIYGIDTYGNGGDIIDPLITEPLISINNIGRNPNTNNSILLYNNGWDYSTINEVSELIKQYFTENNYWSIGSEPDEYLKRVSSSGNTLIFTKKDGSTWSYTPSDTGGGTGTLSQPLSSIGDIGMNPVFNKSFLYYNDNNWGYTTLDNVAQDIHQYLTDNHYYNSIGSQVSISNLKNANEGIRIATITINGTPNDIIAPVGDGGNVTIEGDNVSATAEYDTGKKLATISINNEPTYIYMPPISYQEIPDTPNIPAPYDDEEVRHAIEVLDEGVEEALNELEQSLTEARQQLQDDLTNVQNNFNEAKQQLWDSIEDLDDKITEANNIADGEWDRLTDFTSALDTEIQTKVENLLDDAQWVQQNFPSGSGSTSNFGESDVEAYLQRIGVWSRNNDVTKTQWSTIVQKVDTIQLAVDAISSGGDLTEALQASITEAVNSGIASLNLETMYARKSAENVIEWMYSALKNQTSSDYTYNQIVSAGKNSLSSAVSEIRTAVTKTQDGTFVASANIETVVDNAISGLRTSTSSNSAKTYIFNKINTNSDNISAIISAATADASGTTIANKFANYRSGATFRSAVDSAIANLLTTSGSTASGLMLKSTWDSAQASLITTSNISGYTSGFLAKTDLAGSVADLLATTNTSSAAINLRSKLDGAVASLINSTGNSLSGVATKTYVDSATSSLTSSISNTYATKSALNTTNSNLSTTSTALSGVTTRVTNVENNYVAKTSLGSLVKNEIKTNDDIVAEIKSRTGLVTQADINSATNTLASQISTNYATKSALNTTNTNVTNVNNALSTVQTKVTALENAGYLATASFGTVLKQRLNDSDIKAAVIAAAGVVSESTIDSKITSAKNTIFSSVEGTYAKITTTVTKDSNGIISNASINANNINLDSSHQLKITAANQLNITTSVLKSIINNATIDIIGSATINASQLNLTANDILAKLGNASIAASKIDFSASTFKLAASKIDFSSGTYSIDASHLNITASDILAKLGNASIAANKIDFSTGTYSISAGKIDFSTGTYTIAASHLNLTASDILAKLGSASISADKINFNTGSYTIDASRIDFTGGSIIDFGVVNITNRGVTVGSTSSGGDNIYSYIRGGEIEVTDAGSYVGTKITGGQLSTREIILGDDNGNHGATITASSYYGLIIESPSLTLQNSGYSIELHAGTNGLGINSNIVPNYSDSYSLGNSTYWWKSLYTKEIQVGNSTEYGIIGYDQVDHHITFDSDIWFQNNYGIYWDDCNIYQDDNSDLQIDIPSGSGVYTHRIVVDYLEVNGHSVTSDERLKENIVEKEANISDIANTRIVDFNFKDEEEKNFGSIAQDWQSIFPNAVKQNKKGYLGMDYGAIALGSAVTAAREIVTLKEKVQTLEEENQSLKERLANIEATLERINTALG